MTSGRDTAQGNLIQRVDALAHTYPKASQQPSERDGKRGSEDSIGKRPSSNPGVNLVNDQA